MKGHGSITTPLTREVLQALVEYDPFTGEFRNRRNKIPMGVANSDGKSGIQYVKIAVGGKSMYAHRLAFLYMTGVIPDCIDHVSGNGLDNRWENLRSVTRSGNMRNTKLSSRNTSGIVGVSWIKRTQRWSANILGKEIVSTEDFFEACCARKSAELALGFHENHGRRAA